MTEACRPGGALHGAVRGNFLDSEAPEFLEWMAAGKTAEGSAELRHLALRKKRAEIQQLETRNEIIAGRLVSLELVRKTCFSHLSELDRRLFQSAGTLQSRVESMSRSGVTREEQIAAIRSLLLVNVEVARAKVIESIRNGPRTPLDPPPVTETVREDTTEDAIARELAHTFEQRAPDIASNLVEYMGKDFARAAAGQPFAHAVFDAAMALLGTVAEDAKRTATRILRACVQSTHRSVLEKRKRERAELALALKEPPNE